MGYLDHPSDTDPADDNAQRTSRLPLVAAVAAVVLVLAVAVWWFTPPSSAPVPETPAPRETTTPAAPPPPSPPTEPAPETAPAPRARVRPAPRPVPVPAPDVETPAPPPRVLSVDADVSGALIFLDREFLGNAPVRTSEVTPGRHQLNVSAEGYDGVAQTIEVADTGETSVTIRLKEVRLDAGVDVIHKHAMGSCAGRLSATLQGFRYVPTRGGDAFTLPLAAVDAFEIDYLKKNLRLKQRGGKTWNFESPSGSADPLFVFHRDVEKARSRLNGQSP
jgi:hypothetical protein